MRFSDWLKRNVKPIPNYYGVVSDIESSKDDFYLLSHSEMVECIQDCGITTVTGVTQLVSYINNYLTDYELTEFGRKLNKSLVLSQSETMKCVLKKAVYVNYISKEELDVVVRSCTSWNERYVVLGIYEGIGSYGKHLSDLTMTRASGINADAKTITLRSGNTFEYSDRLIEAAILASKEDYGYDALGKRYENINQGTILRYPQRSSETNDEAVKGIYVSRMLKRIRERSGIDVTAQTLNRSGLMYALKNRLHGERLTYKNREAVEDILVKYNSSKSSLEAINKRIRYSAPK